MSDNQIRILFLAANPNATAPLDLDTEYEQIETTLRETSLTKSILLQHRWKLSREQLLGFFLQYRPHIVHFSGHGTEDNLILQDRDGNAWPLERKTAREAFKTTSNVTRLVVLNACYSRDVAEDISEVVDCVIGMSQPVYDHTAVKFAGSLYRGLGEGLSVSDAFERARTELKVSGLPGANLPQIVSRPGLDPRRVFLKDWLTGEVHPPPIDPGTKPKPVTPESDHRALPLHWWIVGGILVLAFISGAVIWSNRIKEKEARQLTPRDMTQDMAQNMTRDMKQPPDLACPPGTTLQKGVCRAKPIPPPPPPPNPVQPRTWDLARDFRDESATNLNGEWTYGWAKSDPSEFTPFGKEPNKVEHVLNSGISVPTFMDKKLTPCVWKNTSGQEIYSVLPGKISLHPGQENELSIVRWSNPGQKICAGQVHIRIKFSPGNRPTKMVVKVAIDRKLFTAAHDEWFERELPANTVKDIYAIVAVPPGMNHNSGNTVLDATITCTGSGG